MPSRARKRKLRRLTCAKRLPSYLVATYIQKRNFVSEQQIALSGDAIKAYNSMEAVKNDPNALAREAAKWTPDIIYKVLSVNAGKAFMISGYFLGAGIDALDANHWDSIAKLKLNTEMRKLHNQGSIDESEWLRLKNFLSTDPGQVNRMIIAINFKLKGAEQNEDNH